MRGINDTYLSVNEKVTTKERDMIQEKNSIYYEQSHDKNIGTVLEKGIQSNKVYWSAIDSDHASAQALRFSQWNMMGID